MIEIDAEKLKEFWGKPLAQGNHEPGGEKCANEAQAWLAGEPHSDMPACTPPTIARVQMRLNDRMGDERRQQLKPYLLRSMGLDKSPELERKRAFLAADAAVREFLPLALEAQGITGWPEKLRALPEIVDGQTAEAGRDIARETRYASYAAASARAATRARIDALALSLLDKMIAAKL